MMNSMGVSESIKSKTAIGSSNSTTGYISKQNEISLWKGHIYSHVCAALFTMGKRWKQNKGPSTGE
jgi:hypothetical protein